MTAFSKNVGILGIPIERGQALTGVACATKLLRKKDLIEEIESYGLFGHDYGDVDLVKRNDDPDIFNSRYPRSFYENSLKISAKFAEIMQKDNVMITIGGDHSMSTGTILGNAQVHGNLSVLWVDAHADINNPMSSDSRSIHGMPLSFLVHEMQSEIPWIDEFQGLHSVIPAKNLAYIGLRAVDNFERHVIEKYNIKAFSMDDVDKKGINCCVQEAIQAINPNLDRYFHLSFDVDALDPIYAPSTGTNVPGGLTLREGMCICEQLYNTGKLIALDLAEINTQKLTYSDAIKTLNSGKKLILACLGAKRFGRAHIDPDYYNWKYLNPSRNEIFDRYNFEELGN